ncbi:MAG: PocR ligand-binding domain-containing protein [Desulfovibrionales bacterium]
MEMTDLLSKEKWIELEKKLHDEFGVNACAYNAQGMSFTGFKNFINPLCAEIKSHQGGIQAICSVAHQHMARQARETGETIIEQCDAGMLKICTPIFVNKEFIGIVGGCGRVPEGREIDTFLVHKATSVPLENIENLAKEVPVITEKQAREIKQFLEEFVRNLQHD